MLQENVNVNVDESEENYKNMMRRLARSSTQDELKLFLSDMFDKERLSRFLDECDKKLGNSLESPYKCGAVAHRILDKLSLILLFFNQRLLVSGKLEPDMYVAKEAIRIYGSCDVEKGIRLRSRVLDSAHVLRHSMVRVTPTLHQSYMSGEYNMLKIVPQMIRCADFTNKSLLLEVERQTYEKGYNYRQNVEALMAINYKLERKFLSFFPLEYNPWKEKRSSTVKEKVLQRPFYHASLQNLHCRSVEMDMLYGKPVKGNGEKPFVISPIDIELLGGDKEFLERYVYARKGYEYILNGIEILGTFVRFGVKQQNGELKGMAEINTSLSSYFRYNVDAWANLMDTVSGDRRVFTTNIRNINHLSIRNQIDGKLNDILIKACRICHLLADEDIEDLPIDRLVEIVDLTTFVVLELGETFKLFYELPLASKGIGSTEG